MTTFKIVNADAPEPEAVEKPVELKWELGANGSPQIWARQNDDWVKLVFVTDDGILHLFVNSMSEISDLPGLEFADQRTWRTE